MTILPYFATASRGDRAERTNKQPQLNAMHRKEKKKGFSRPAATASFASFAGCLSYNATEASLFIAKIIGQLSDLDSKLHRKES